MDEIEKAVIMLSRTKSYILDTFVLCKFWWWECNNFGEENNGEAINGMMGLR